MELPGEVAWQDEPEPPPRPSNGLARRQAMVLLAVVAAIALGAAGILLARSLTGSDGATGTTLTTGSTTQVTTDATTETTTTPTDSPTTTTPTTSTPTSTTPSTTAVPTGTTLRPGDSGASVLALQQTLASLGFDPGAADGKYGTATTGAVTAFQKAKGLTEDGVAGPTTIAAINTAAAGSG